MGYLMAAIVFGMLIWAGFDIVQNIRNWENNPTKTTSRIQDDMIKEAYRGQLGGQALDGGSEVVGQVIHASHCAAEVACETSPNAIGHVLEGLLHVVHH
jgi:hypothetical protein